MSHLEAEERETIISWCDDDEDGMIFIHTTQLPMMRKLCANPLFKIIEYHKFPNEEPFGVDGYLPLRCLTLRKSHKTRTLSEEQKEQLRTTLKKARAAKTLNRQSTKQTHLSSEVV